ncbi:MAG TPA: alpha/beta fold hydrolase [Actinomycetota bacterium]|nr:alpha/beta fold hydrolase [Actinomycetota bacterium]
MPIADLGDVQLHYRQRGDGPTVLGVMGFALDQRYWAAQIPAVTATHSFLTFDNRGTGRSSPGTVTSIDEMADDAVRLLDHLDIERAVLFGVSMGGAIAQRLVLDHPERVSALILGITWARPTEFMRRQNAVGRRLAALGTDALVDATLVRMFTPRFFELGQEAVDRMVASFTTDSGPAMPGADVLTAQLDAIDKHDVLAELGRVSCPTLVFGAHMDVMVPFFASEEIAAAIPGAELAAFETGHGCMVEEMDAVNERIARFLGGLT